jgi:alpha-glucosidase
MGDAGRGGIVGAPDASDAEGGGSSTDAGGETPPDGGSASPPCSGEPPRGTLERLADGSVAVRVGAAPLVITGFADGIVRLAYGPPRVRASYAVTASALASKVPLRVGVRDGRAVVCTEGEARLVVAIDPANGRLRVEDAAGDVLLDDGPSGGFFRDEARREAHRGPESVHGVDRLLAPSERIFGLGLRTGEALDRRGRVLEMWNTDAYDASATGFRPDEDPLYQSIPFYIGLRRGVAHGVFTDVTARLRFDVGATSPARHRILAFDNEPFEQYVLAGPKMADVVRRYTTLTGTMPLPPKWSIGFHLSRWEGDCAARPVTRPFCSAPQIVELARTLRAKGFPADGVFLDIQHMDGFRTFTFDSTLFPDPASLVRELASFGLKTSIIVDPGIKVDPGYRVYDEGIAGDFFLRDGDAVYEGDVWPGRSVFPDFSAPRVRAWWASWVAESVRTGIRGAWIDMNEPSVFGVKTVPDRVRAHGDGVPATMAEMHNVYALSEAKATFDGMRAGAPEARPFVLSRAAYAGQQRYSAVWTGDAPSTWSALRATLPQLVSLGVSGLTFAGSDVGGYSGRDDASAELYARWMAIGSLSPFFRVHAEKDARRQEPWAFGPEVEAACRAFVERRYALLPYLYSLFDEARRQGTPILRPLVHEFQHDDAAHGISDQAMLGPAILVAPIVERGATVRSIYLPRLAGMPGGPSGIAPTNDARDADDEGWLEWNSGASYASGRRVELGASGEVLPYDALPMFVPHGAIVVHTAPALHTGASQRGPLLVDVVPSRRESAFVLYEDEGDGYGDASGRFARTRIETQKTERGAVVRLVSRTGSYAVPGRPLIVRVRPIDAPPTRVVVGGRVVPSAASFGGGAVDGAGEAFVFDENDRSVVVRTGDAAPLAIELEYPAPRRVADTVRVTFRVRVPPGTDRSRPPHIASGAWGWAHRPLSFRDEPDVATGSFDWPRGQYAAFKVTRGDWATVEKALESAEGNPRCVERANRVAFGRSHDVELTVAAWADRCP